MNACYSISIPPIRLDKWCEQYFSLTFYEYTNSSAVLVPCPSASVKSYFFSSGSCLSFWITLLDAQRLLNDWSAVLPIVHTYFFLLPVHLFMCQSNPYFPICTSFCSTANSDFEIRRDLERHELVEPSIFF